MIKFKAQDFSKHIKKLKVGSQLWEMPICIHNLDIRVFLHLLLHEERNRFWSSIVVAGADDGAWSRDLVDNVSMVAVKDGFGQGEGNFRPHSL